MEMPPQNKLDFNYIVDGIYIGTNQCCQTHFDEKLKKEGITADISLEEDRLDAPFGLEFGVSVLEKLVSMGKKVYVHCKNGHGRAPTLVAAYLTKKGKSSAEAEAFIKSKRPTMHLEDIQRQALEDFSKK